MDLRKLPITPLWFFYAAFKPQTKRLYLLLSLLLLVCVVLTVWNYHFPYFWTLQIEASGNSFLTSLVLNECEYNYRTYPLYAEAFYGLINYQASPMQPAIGMLILLVLAQIAGWAALLTASARIEGVWVYVVWFFMALFLYHSEWIQLLELSDSWKLSSFGLIMVFLLPAWVFHSRRLDWSLPAQFLVYVVLLLVFFVTAYLYKGRAGLHRVAVFPMAVQGFIAIVLIILVAKDLTNLVVYAGTSRPNVADRISIGSLMAILTALVLVSAIWVLQDLGWLNAGGMGGLRPVHFFAVAVLATPFTTYNALPGLYSIIPSRAAFSMLLLGISLLGTSLLMFHAGNSEVIVIRNSEQLMAKSFFLIGVLFILYLVVNFQQALQEKVNLFWGLMAPPKVPFTYVWGMAVIIMIIQEGVNRWPVFMTYAPVLINGMGDNAILRGNLQDARLSYASAAQLMRTDPKANFNTAGLLVVSTEANDPYNVHQYFNYSYARTANNFSYGLLNHANYYAAQGEFREAKNLLINGLHTHKFNDARLYNNLGLLYRQLLQPDSANWAFEKALSLSSGLVGAQNNAAILDLESGKLAQATQKLKNAYATYPTEPTVRLNAMFLALQTKDSTVRSVYIFDTTKHDFAFHYNNMLLAWQQAEYQKADSLNSWLISRQPIASVYRIQLLTKAFRDSVEATFRTANYIKANFPASVYGGAAQVIGWFFVRKAMPEAAARWYDLSGQLGIGSDSLAAALLYADAGEYDSAIVRLENIQGLSKNQLEMVRKELNIILRATGRDSTPATKIVANLRPDEALRLAKYSADCAVLDVSLFDAIARQDSKDVRAYYEISKLLRQSGNDSAGLINIAAGLKRQPLHPQLLTEAARMLIRTGKIPAAQETLALAQKANLNSFSAAEKEALLAQQTIVSAELLWAQQAHDSALNVLRTGNKRYPFNTDLVIALTEKLNAKSLYAEASTTAFTIVAYNPYNWKLLQHYAKALWQLGVNERAKEMAQQAVALIWLPARRTVVETALQPILAGESPNSN